ncbi:Zinc knuckle [Popillia japonica]|uniref:Zinc knuckle n=1 Tax=Popillia japonica TaxID=7064 RepID=A0AAW1IEJ7_POPJA
MLGRSHVDTDNLFHDLMEYERINIARVERIRDSKKPHRQNEASSEETKGDDNVECKQRLPERQNEASSEETKGDDNVECKQRLPERRRSDNKPLCFKCRKYGHVAKYCGKAKIICFKCKTEGHMAAQCPNANQDRENLLIGGITENTMMNAKYFKEAKINGKNINSYIDTGSKCVTLREADANILGLEYEVIKSPFRLTGYGSGKVTPLGECNALVEVDQAESHLFG